MIEIQIWQKKKEINKNLLEASGDFEPNKITWKKLKRDKKMNLLTLKNQNKKEKEFLCSLI